MPEGEAGIPLFQSPNNGENMNQVTGLIHFNRAQQELHKAKTIDVVIAIRNAAAEIRLRAERRAGEMLNEAAEKGDRKAVGRPENSPNVGTIFTLSEIGINKNQASRWQSIAAIPEDQFEQVIRETKEANREPTQRALLKIAQEIRGEQPMKRHKSEAQVDQQPTLFDLGDYQKTIDHYVSQANHYIRLARQLKQQAFRRYHVQIPLPFEFTEDEHE